MKKIALTLLSLFLITPCMANIHIDPKMVAAVIKKMVPAEKVNATITSYNTQLKASRVAGGGAIQGISANRLWNVCAAAGWDIKKPAGKQSCQNFVTAMVKKAIVNFVTACDKDKKGKAGNICVDNFFTNKVYGGTQVKMRNAIALSLEYIRVKYNDTQVQCRDKANKSGLDYGVLCVSRDKNAAYELIFDDVEESEDKIIQDSIQSAICRMYDAKPTTAGCAPNTPICWGASCAASSAKCTNINQSMAKFGYAAIYKNNKCEINFNTIRKKEDLKTAYKIDNFVFCKGIQVSNEPNVETHLKKYVSGIAKVPVNSVVCSKGFNTYTGPGCSADGMPDLKDDIIRCSVGTNHIDFVFEDVNEAIKTTSDGGVQGMSCIVSGGAYSGERCIGLGEQQCNTLRQSNLKECPECKAAKWDKETQSCLLPSSKSAQNLQKGINIGLIVGGTIAGVVITVATFGGFAATAAAAGAVATGTATAAQTTAIVFTSLETVGAGIELTSQLKINGIADDFLVESNKCKNATCAKKMLSQNLQRMANYANDMTAAEADAVDTEMARLANLIPDNDEIWATMLVNGTDMADNKQGFFDTDSWEPEQVWRAVGIGLQLTSLITGITKWAISKSSRVVKSTAAIKQKFARAIQSIDNAPESTLRAKRLELKQLAKNGKKVADNADGTIVIPKAQMAAPKDPLLEAHDAAVIDEQFSKIERNIFKGQEGKNIDKIAVLQDLVDVERSNLTATQYRAAMIETISEDAELYRYMEDFEKLTDAQKTDFAKKIVSKINTKLGDGTPTGQVFAVSFDGQYPRAVRGNTYNGDIYINTDGKGSNLLTGRMVDNKTAEGFLSSLSHEHAHGIDDLNPGTGALSEKVVKESAELYDDAHYLENPLEIMAHSREEWVADGNLVNDIRTRHTEIVNSSKQSTHTSPQPAPIRRTASTTTNTSSALQSAKNKLYTYGTDFDKVVDDFLRNDGGYPAWWKMSDLTPAEHNALQSFLKEKGITLTTETQELNGVKETFYRLKK